MKHVFGFQRSLLKAARPCSTGSRLPNCRPIVTSAISRNSFKKSRASIVLEDPQLTSVRLVTNPEKMVLRETQRAFVYFTLHGLTVDHIIVNRLLPDTVQDNFFAAWHASQRATLAEIIRYFDPVPTKKVPLFAQEVLGYDRLRGMAERLYGANEDPSAVTRETPPFSFVREADHYEVRINMPFAVKGEVGLFKKNDELVVEVAPFAATSACPPP